MLYPLFRCFCFLSLRVLSIRYWKMHTMGVCKIKHFKSIIVTVTLILVMSAEFSTELDMHGRHLNFIALDVSILHLSVLVYYIFPIRLYVKFIVLNTSLLVMDRLRLFAILNNSFLKFKYTRNYVKVKDL